MGGPGWLGGFSTVWVEMNNPTPTAPDASTIPVAPTLCSVPSLHGLSLRVAKAHLRAAHCSIGAIRLAAGATAGKGKVVKQFRAAGTELASGVPVCVKLGWR